VQPVVLDAGGAWFEGDGQPVTGTVCGVFRLAAYLRLDGRILAVCGPGVAPGPLHLRLDRLPPLARGQRVRRTAGRVEVVGPATSRLSIDESCLPRWAPRPVDPAALRRRRAPLPPAGTAAAAGLPPRLVEAAARLLSDGELTALAQLVGGRGPGLTPAGDDLLAGALVAHAALHPDAEAGRRAAVAAARTNDVAAAFLGWAARGQCIQPVHEVLGAMADCDPAGEAAARTRLHQVGASSGAALLLGLDLALMAEAVRSAC
jgi:hypothetical protein